MSGCSWLPGQNVQRIDQRLVEYAWTPRDASSPTVVFENGLDGTMASWTKVIPAVSKDAATFAYNRPGYARSDPVTTPRDGQHVIDELRALLASVGARPPYVLVGHSLGGLYMQLYARRYPDDVAALVLVDSTHPDQFRGAGAVEHWPAWFAWGFRMYLSMAARAEWDAINATGEEVLALPSVSGKPVIVLSALQPMQESSDLANDANAKRRDLARLYPGARQVWVDSGHDIPIQRPQAVVAAIRQVLPGPASTPVAP